MRGKLITAVALTGAIALIGCSDTPDVLEGTTLPDTEDVQEDAQDVVDEVQTEMEALATQIENSEAADELQGAWTEIEAEIQAAVNSAMSDGTFDTTEIEQQLDDFQQTLEAAGEDVDDELMAAWTELRQTFEELMN